MLSSDDKNDLVLLKVDGKNLPFLSLGNSEGLQGGERVFVVGSPTGLMGSVSEGIVSGIRGAPSFDSRRIQITAAISQGSSGSPVMNNKCQVIGVARSFAEEGQSLNFAIPVECIRNLLAHKGTKNRGN